jgi:ATP-binding cassette subfamily B protein
VDVVEQTPKWWHLDRRAIRLRFKLVRLLPQASWPLSIGLLLVLLIGAIVPPLLMISIAHAISQVASSTGGRLLPSSSHRLLIDLIVVACLIGLGRVAAPLQGPIATQLGMRARTILLSRLVAAHVDPPSLAHLDDPYLKDVVDRANDPRQVGIQLAISGLVSRWSTRLGSVGAFVLLGLYQWWAAVLMLLAVTHSVRRMRIAHLEISRSLYRESRTFRRSGYLRDLLARAGAEKEVRVFGLGDWLSDRFRSEWYRAMNPVWARRRRSARDMALGVLPVVGVMALIAALAFRDAVDKVIGTAELVVVLQALFSAFGASSVSTADSQVELGMTALESVEAVEASFGERQTSMAGSSSLVDRAMPQSAIHFEDVHFAYPGSEQETLRGIELVIPAQRSLAVVGDNGAGKTTLVKLLARLVDPTGGRISVDGVPLTDLDPRAWQRNCAAVFQDFVRYPWSAAENIALRSDAPLSDLEDAAARADALGLIRGLPNGWETVLSRAFGGVDLSGGEWQRIALARALFAADHGARVLVLDEPTAHLDIRSEASFYDRFLELTAGRTVIVISHRFATVRRADLIVVVEQGIIAEAGTHDALMDLGGRYARLFNLQAAAFIPGDEQRA